MLGYLPGKVRGCYKLRVKTDLESKHLDLYPGDNTEQDDELEQNHHNS